MELESRHSVAFVGVIAMVVTVAAVRVDTALGTAEWGVTLAGTLIFALAFGHLQYRHDSDSENSDRPFFEPGSRYTAFWGLYYALFVHTLALPGRPTGPGAPTAVVPAWTIAVAWVAMTVVAVALGGVSQQANPSYWLRAFREGRADRSE